MKKCKYFRPIEDNSKQSENVNKKSILQKIEGYLEKFFLILLLPIAIVFLPIFLLEKLDEEYPAIFLFLVFVVFPFILLVIKTFLGG